jgi:hypothetical protein
MTDDIIGLPVLLPSACSACGATLATIGAGDDGCPARFICVCGARRARMSADTHSFLTSIANSFGRPTTPIVVRRPVPPATAEEPGHSAQTETPIETGVSHG